MIRTVGSQEVAINIVKFIQKDETLADFFAERVVSWITECEARGLVNAILCEINEVKDVKAQNGLVKFMGTLAEKRPEDFIRHFSMTVQLIGKQKSVSLLKTGLGNLPTEKHLDEQISYSLGINLDRFLWTVFFQARISDRKAGLKDRKQKL